MHWSLTGGATPDPRNAALGNRWIAAPDGAATGWQWFTVTDVLLERVMPGDASWTTPHGGFFSWLTLPGVDTTELAVRAVEQRVGIVPGALFFPDGRGADSVRLSFSLVDETQIDEGIERLAALLR